ncbi:MAG TPA: cytochrome P450 [Kofleriaceae bacterium]|nr:cytochrome P450 [Kofleriaceae bacterium]
MTLPPGPRAPSWAQLARWVMRPLPMLDECHREHGDLITLRVPFDGAIIVVASPELIREVLTADGDVLRAGAGNATVVGPLLGKHSLLTLDGAEHLRQRRLLLPAFHGERMHAFATVMRGITEASLEAWPVGAPFSLHPMMQSITLDVILRTVFGVANTDDKTPLRAALVELLELAATPLMLTAGLLKLDVLRIPWLKVTKLKHAIDDELYRVIAERRRAGAGGTDVLSMMIAARDEHGRAMSDVELRDELVTLLVAGHETTATSLAWTFDQLLANPHTLVRLRDELAAGRDEYLDAVIRETLRLRPIVPLVGRVVAKPFQLGGYTFREGARLAPSIYLAGRHAATYRSPEQFEPERWIGVKPDPYTWLPFGGGIRRCIGMAFAQFEMRVVLQTVVPRVRLRLADGPARVVRRGITLAPSGGTRVVLEERAAPARSHPPRAA